MTIHFLQPKKIYCDNTYRIELALLKLEGSIKRKAYFEISRFHIEPARIVADIYINEGKQLELNYDKISSVSKHEI